MKKYILAALVIFLGVATLAFFLVFNTVGMQQILDIQPNSIQQKIYELAKEKKYQEINQLIQKITTFNELKKLVDFQINIALLLANQIAFDQSETLAFSFKPEQKYIIFNMALLNEDETDKQKIQEQKKVISERRKVQWLYVFLELKDELEEITTIAWLNITLKVIHEFLEDLGSIAPIEYTEAKTLDDVKKIIANNFKQLFDRLFLVLAVQPKVLPQLEALRKAMKAK